MVVFFDIDGTLVDDDTQIIPASAVRAVEALGRAGHLAVVNTGRLFSHIDPRIRDMAFGGYVCGCGMEIRLRDRWIYRVAPEQWLCDQVVKNVRECGMAVLFEAEGAVVTDGERSKLPPDTREVERLVAKGIRHEDISGRESCRFTKLITRDLPGCRRAEFLARMETDFTCIDRGKTMVEHVLKGCSKAAGMEKLLQALDCPREETLAIGDSTNDLPMFRAAGHTACMGNGVEELKAQAEYITASVLDDGIEKALAHFGLI